MNIEKIEIEFDGDTWTARPIPYLVVGQGEAYGKGATPELAIQSLRWAFEQCKVDRQIVANIPSRDYSSGASLYIYTVRDEFVAGYGSPLDLKAFLNPAPIDGLPLPISHVVMDTIMEELKRKGARPAPEVTPSSQGVPPEPRSWDSLPFHFGESDDDVIQEGDMYAEHDETGSKWVPVFPAWYGMTVGAVTEEMGSISFHRPPRDESSAG